LAERERAEDVSGEDAAWRDLVARFDQPGRPDAAAPPWPERENLPAAWQQPGAGAGADAVAGAGPGAGASPAADTPASDDDSGADGDPTADDGSAAGNDKRPGPHAASDPGGNDGLADAGQPGTPEPAIPDRTRVIKPAIPAPLPAADEDEDDHYIPPPPPPLPALDPVAKGAWAGLFGGPAYLLVATSAGWVLPGWATFGAVAAFVGGFAVLVIRMGDKPSRGSGPDNGAVL
jgi:hypothetical protein